MNIPIVTVDAETYYDVEYSLSKITTESYIRSSQFEEIGWSIWLPEQPTPVWYPGKTGIPILQAVDWSTHAFLAHNTAFDGSIAAWRYNIHPRLYLDTLSMAQPHFGFTTGVSLASLLKVLNLGEKGDEILRAIGKHLHNFTPDELAAYGRYCINDNAKCRALFQVLMTMTAPKELAAIDSALRCFIEPRIVLDKEVLQEYHEHVVAVKETNYIWAGNMLGIESEDVQKAIMSNDKFAEILKELGVDPPTKLSPATGNPAYAFAKTDDAFLALKEHEDERVQVLVECRLGGKSTLAETRALRLLEAAERGPLPAMMRYYAALTGRLGGGDSMNLQNLPRHIYDEAGTLIVRSKLRDAMCAPPNHEFISGDLSQIEARILALIAGQDDVVEAFRRYDIDPANNPDIYCVTASGLLGRVITKKDNPKERQLGKVCRLALGYGMGVDRFIVTAKRDRVILAPPLAASLHKRFRDLSPQIVSLWLRAGEALVRLMKGEEYSFGVDGCIVVRADGIHLPSGRVLRYPGLERNTTIPGGGGFGWQYTYMNRKKRVRIYGAKVVENICQSLAGSVCSDAWLRLRNKLPIAMQVHDELVGIAYKDDIDVACEHMRAALTAPVKWLPELPVACTVGHAWRYGEVEK